MIISVANQKGGQGKSTLAQAIATGAAHRGKKSLAIDFDPQGNLSFSMGGNIGDKGAFELLQGTPAGQIIQKTQQGDIIPASLTLASIGKIDDTVLRDAIKGIAKKYDLITIDCPPTLNELLLNALVASDTVIIPLTADIYALQGLYQLANTIRATQDKYRNAAQIGGAVFMRHNTRTVLARDLADVIGDTCAKLEIPLYKHTIREGVAVREAQTQRQSIFDYAPKAAVTKDFNNLLDEIGIK